MKRISRHHYALNVHNGYIVSMRTSWMRGLFIDPISIKEKITINKKGDSENVEGIVNKKGNLIWQHDDYQVVRTVVDHPIWPCPIIEFQVTNKSEKTLILEISWNFFHKSVFTCLYPGRRNETSDVILNEGTTEFPLFFHKIHKERPQNCIWNFKCNLAPAEKTNLICPIWFIRSKYETNFSGFAFLVQKDDIEGAVAALSAQVDRPFEEELIQMLSRKYTPLFWLEGKEVSEDVLRFIRAAPIQAIISLQKLGESSRNILLNSGIILREIEGPSNSFLEDLVQRNIDELLDVNRQNDKIIVCPCDPVFMISLALTSAAHGYRLLLMRDGIYEQIRNMNPTQVRICNKRDLPIPYDLISRLVGNGIKWAQYSEDNISVIEGTANALTLFGSIANIFLDHYLYPTDSSGNMVKAIVEGRERGASQDDMYFITEPHLNGPPIVIVSTYDENNYRTAISAANYAKSKNATVYTIHDFSQDTKRQINLNLKELSDFIRGDVADLWNDLFRLSIIKSFLSNQDTRLSVYQSSEMQKGALSYSYIDPEKAEEWLKAISPDDWKEVQEGSLRYEDVNAKIIQGLQQYRAYIPQSVISIIPADALVPFPAITSIIIHLIGRLMLRELSESVLAAFWFPAKKSVLFFPADPSVPLELLTIPENESFLNTMHSSFAFGRMVCNDPNDAPLQCGYSLLNLLEHTKKNLALVVVNPTDDLPDSTLEGQAIERNRMMEAESLTGRMATKDNVIKGLCNSSLAYFSCHGGLSTDNRPYLILRDGCLHGDDLPNLQMRPLVFANACHSAADLGFSTTGSLALSFIKRGAIAYIGTLWQVESQSAAFIGTALMDGLFEKPIGTALSTIRNPGILPDYTGFSYILFGDPTLSLSDPLLFSAEAYFFSKLTEHYQRMESWKFVKSSTQKAITCFEAMSEEFLDRSIRDIKNRRLWDNASSVAKSIVLQFRTDYYIAAYNLATANEQKDEKLRLALDVLQKGEELYPDNPWFRARKNGLLGMNALWLGYELLKSKPSGIQPAQKEFSEAARFFQAGAESEPSKRIQQLLVSHKFEAEGLASLCQGMKELGQSRKSYDSLVDSFRFFMDGSERASVPQVKEKLIALQKLPLKYLINWDKSALNDLESRYTDGKITKIEFENMRRKINERVCAYEQLLLGVSHSPFSSQSEITSEE